MFSYLFFFQQSLLLLTAMPAGPKPWNCQFKGTDKMIFLSQLMKQKYLNKIINVDNIWFWLINKQRQNTYKEINKACYI